MNNTYRIQKSTQAPWTPGLVVNPRAAMTKWVESLSEREYRHLEFLIAEVKHNTVTEVLAQIDASPVVGMITHCPPDFKLVKARSFRLI